MITNIYFDEDIKKTYSSKENTDSIENLSRLNILIGANNSGKSRFIRKIFSGDNFTGEVSELNKKYLLEIFNKLIERSTSYLKSQGYQEISDSKIQGVLKIYTSFIEKIKGSQLNKLEDLLEEINQLIENIENFQATGGSPIKGQIIYNSRLEPTSFGIKEIFRSLKLGIQRSIPEKINYPSKRIYIPILRGLRPIQLGENDKFDEISDNYNKRTKRDYFKELDESKEIYTGLSLYTDLKKMLLGKYDQREKVKEFELFLSEAFFGGKQLTLIPNIEDDSVHVLIGSEERPIYDLGDGIQSLIILLYPLFFNIGKNLLVFIEEPENSLHPGLQRLFIETIMGEKFNSFQYFITTHSNHLLDLTIDFQNISVYSFSRGTTATSKFCIANISKEDSNILSLIGVRNSSVFLSNCTIWVEGITDRLYLKRLLEIYEKSISSKDNFKEDFNYSFIEYGGNNIAHWSFDSTMSSLEQIRANRISSKIFLLVDQDSTPNSPNSKKSKRLEKLKKILKKNFFITPGIEIENILSPNVIIETVLSLEKTNRENVKYNLRNIKYLKYKKLPLGAFISLNFKNTKRKFKSDSGTINNKLEFCKVANSHMHSIDDLEQDAIMLAKKVYTFIKASNKE